MDTTANSVIPETKDDQRYHIIYNRFHYLFERGRSKEHGGYFFCIGPGWLSMLEETLEQIDHALKPKERKGSERFQIVQIKEKFGGLRLYYDYGNSNVDWFRFWLQGYEDPDPAKAAQYARWRSLRANMQ